MCKMTVTTSIITIVSSKVVWTCGVRFILQHQNCHLQGTYRYIIRCHYWSRSCVQNWKKAFFLKTREILLVLVTPLTQTKPSVLETLVLHVSKRHVFVVHASKRIQLNLSKVSGWKENFLIMKQIRRLVAKTILCAETRRCFPKRSLNSTSEISEYI